jgi:hypothetical protein
MMHKHRRILDIDAVLPTACANSMSQILYRCSVISNHPKAVSDADYRLHPSHNQNDVPLGPIGAAYPVPYSEHS